jgi:hypothetical protein
MGNTFLINGLLNLSGDFRSSGGTGSLLGTIAPAGSPLPRTPAGVERLPLHSTLRKNYHELYTYSGACHLLGQPLTIFKIRFLQVNHLSATLAL